MKLNGIFDGDPLLDAVDAAHEAHANERAWISGALGAGGIGEECSRRLWYEFRWIEGARKKFAAKTLRLFEDGHRAEDIMAERLRRVPGVTLWTEDPEWSGTGNKQIGVRMFGGRFKAFADGVIVGIPQAPKTPHVWEHKATNEKKFAALKKAIKTQGEKEALAAWDAKYYAQAQVLMTLLEIDRHLLTVSTPGVRDVVTVRTEKRARLGGHYVEKASHIIYAEEPPPRITSDPCDFRCKFCPAAGVCHNKSDAAEPPETCRTCVHFHPGIGDDLPKCVMHDVYLDLESQAAGCEVHETAPAFQIR